jgi:hypothetical protein
MNSNGVGENAYSSTVLCERVSIAGSLWGGWSREHILFRNDSTWPLQFDYVVQEKRDLSPDLLEGSKTRLTFCLYSLPNSQ